MQVCLPNHIGDGPAWVDTAVNPQELAIPPKAAIETAEGFALVMLKAVMNRCAGEIIGLARASSLDLPRR